MNNCSNFCCTYNSCYRNYTIFCSIVLAHLLMTLPSLYCQKYTICLMLASLWTLRLFISVYRLSHFPQWYLICSLRSKKFFRHISHRKGLSLFFKNCTSSMLMLCFFAVWTVISTFNAKDCWHT